MATNYFKVKNGINVQPAATSVSAEGDIGWNSSTHKLEQHDGTSVRSMVTEDGTQTLTNKTLSGNTASSLINGSGTININSTGTITVPGATDTLVGKATTDTLTNKSLSDSTCAVVNVSDATKKVALSLGGMTTGVTLTLTSTQSTTQSLAIPNVSSGDTVATINATQTLTNKTLATDGTNKIGSTAFSGVTGTGSIVMSASPTLTGTLNAATAVLSGSLTVGGNTTSDANLGTISSVTQSKFYIGTFTMTYTGGTTGFASTQNATATYQLHGRHVTLYIPGVISTTGSGTVGSFTSSALPTAIQPMANIEFPIWIQNNGAEQQYPGSAILSNSTGQLSISRDGLGTNWTSNASGGFRGTTISYLTS